MADYQSHLEEFEAEGIGIIAMSVDPLEKAQETIAAQGVTFPVGYGLRAPEDAEPIGAFWEERRSIFHATNIILEPGGKILQATYSTGPIGRITASDALSYIRFVKKRKQQK